MCGSMSPFLEWFSSVRPIVLRDPLAELTGAFQSHHALLEYSFDDVVKMAGHACPSVGAAFVCCRKALGVLHQGDIPERGAIAVTVHGAPDDKTYGVMGQVFGYVTGACGVTGFKGLGGKFRRKDLLSYQAGGPDDGTMTVTFERVGKGNKVRATLTPARYPVVPGQDRLPALLEKVLANSASHQELHEFQDFWMDRVKALVLDEQDVEAWLSVQPA